MPLRALGRRPSRVALVPLVAVLVAGCSGDATERSDPTADEPGGRPVARAAEESAQESREEPMVGSDGAAIADLDRDGRVAALLDLLPANTRGVALAEVGALVAGDSEPESRALFGGRGDPFFVELFGGIGELTASIDPSDVVTAVVGRTTDAADGEFLLAVVRGETPDDVVSGSALASAGSSESVSLYRDESGRQLAFLPGGVLVVGRPEVVAAVVDLARGAAPARGGVLGPYLDTLDATADFAFVQGLPALYRDVTPDRTLRGASVVSGAFDVAAGDADGELVVHTANATEFVEAYNTLDRNAAQAVPPMATPLIVGDPVVGDLGRVTVPLPPLPLDPTPEQMVPSRHLFKKLLVGMEAYDYAEDVYQPGNAAWFDFLVRSEEDVPPSAGSIYIRWKFRDQAAVEAFEANELPAGFRLAPTRFLESDPPEGGYFLALNLYDGGGGMIVGGARAEWDVFVHGPDGADPNAGVRPRFMVVDVAAEEVSANSRDLLTPAEPVSHELAGGIVRSSVRRLGEEVPVFESSFPVPDPATSEVARFTREMAIGNDYIYWAHGVSDRVLYNATTFNHDAYFIDPSDITVVDNSRWTQYLEPEVSDAVYYVNTLEYVASPMANLVDSEHLDITPAWRDELIGFVNNGHQVGLMRKAVELLFRGQADALVPFRLSNETPSTFYHFEITDPDGLADVLALPPGHRLAPVALFDGDEPGMYLTLAVTDVDDDVAGTRAEWIVYTDDGDGRPNMMVLDLMTEDGGLDPFTFVTLPDVVEHERTGDGLRTTLSSGSVVFDATIDTSATDDVPLSLDWIEAGDDVCRLDGACDEVFYDAETLDVPVRVARDLTIESFATPWSDFVAASPAAVFFRDNAQQYVTKRRANLVVPVDELPFSGLDGRTHVISGSGSLVGRTGDIADSSYDYRGDAVLEDGRLTFAIDQQIVNALGEGHVYTTGSFDLAAGTGTQTVLDCQGPALLCSGIVIGSTEFYTAQDLDASDPDEISWSVDVAVDLGGSFGVADSSSTFLATSVG